MKKTLILSAATLAVSYAVVSAVKAFARSQEAAKAPRQGPEKSTSVEFSAQPAAHRSEPRFAVNQSPELHVSLGELASEAVQAH